MAMRISPYILSLIDWDNPYEDPLRTQFVPVASTRLPDHPALTLDSLHEQDDSPTPGLVHRYHDKVLFLPLDVCPVYCRFCTRSYAIGTDTDEVEKVDYKPAVARWDRAFAYLASRPEIEDVVVSGGDTYMLPAQARALHRRDAPGHPAHPAHPLRHQGSGGDAHEDPLGPRLDRHPGGPDASRGGSCTRKW